MAFRNQLSSSLSLQSSHITEDRGHWNPLNESISTTNDSSGDILMVNDSDTNTSSEFLHNRDAKPAKLSRDTMLTIMDKKIEDLYVMCRNQTKDLLEFKEDIRNSRSTIEQSETNKALADTLNKIVARINRMKEMENDDHMETMDEDSNNRAKSMNIEREIRDAFIKFLRSDELKKNISSAVEESVKSLTQYNVSCELRNLYIRVMERSHLRLYKHITNVLDKVVAEIEGKSSAYSKSVFKSFKYPRHTLKSCDPGSEFSEYLCKILKEIFQNEMKEWRQELSDVFNNQIQEMMMEVSDSEREQSPTSTPDCVSPLDTGNSSVLALSAVITKQIEDGDVNGAFETALSTFNLQLVMVACRAADPDKLFEKPNNLSQCVMMSLLQQLSIDMVGETQLKCKYLEEVILNLDKNNPGICKYLPSVAEEARAHLMQFLNAYPDHPAKRRITVIIMAAYNFMM